MDVKPIVVEAFNIMLEEYTAQGNRWKCKAYNTALNSLKKVPEIRTLDDIKGVKGFGKSLTEHVKEIIKTHKMKSAKRSDKAIAVKELMSVHGIGVQAAKKLADQGIDSIDKLKDQYEKGSVELTDAQKHGLKYYDDIQRRIPHKEMTKHDEYLQKHFLKICPFGKLSVVGSYRRNAKDSGDIDVLITDPNMSAFDNLIDHLEERGYFFGTLARGTVKYNGFCKLPRHRYNRRVDVLYTLPEEYPFALLYFTGSDVFNKEMRAHALTMGYSLNQRNILHTNDNTIVDNYHFDTEKDIFDFLGLEYIQPQCRTSGMIIPKK